MLLLLDNHDSFTYNLAALLRELGQDVVVRQPEELLVAEVLTGAWAGIIISPGPGHPAQAPCRPHIEAVLNQRPQLPILGICLGHQLLALLAGASVTLAAAPVHGHTTCLQHNGMGLFAELPSDVAVMRYHSLVVQGEALPADWLVDAVTADTEQAVMAIRHSRLPLDGLQFHPESIGTLHGEQMLRNWLLQRFPVVDRLVGSQLASLPVAPILPPHPIPQPIAA